MISEELPEHQIFHILKQGAEEAIGPYSQIQIGQLLNEGQIEASDYVYLSRVVWVGNTFASLRAAPTAEQFWVMTDKNPISLIRVLPS